LLILTPPYDVEHLFDSDLPTGLIQIVNCAVYD